MQHPVTDTSSSGPHWGKKEQTMFVHVPLMTGIVLSHNPGSLPLREIPLHMSRLMVVITFHRSCLVSSPDLALAMIAAASPLKLLWSISPLLLPYARRRLAFLPLPTSTLIPDALCIINLSLYSHSCPDHRVHILQEKSHNLALDGQLQTILEFPHLGHVCGHIIIPETC